MTYTTPYRPLAPPQPINTMENVMVEITKLGLVSMKPSQVQTRYAYPTKPSGVGFANRLILSPA